MEFSTEKNLIKSKLFSKRSFLVLFFLLFLVITFLPAHHTDAITVSFESNADYNKRVYGDTDCSITDLPKCFILVVFKFSGFLLALSGTVFTWIINTDNIKLILGGTSTSNPLYELWAYVRDLLNMAFIMVLLFSAFCTIFQVEQYNYKKLLWKIVLMALLVNFSFPITRFIIDTSNILMYTLINTDIASAFTTIASSNGALKELLTPSNFPNNTSLFVATIMIFMLAITLLAVGILLLVRMIALAILIIFSPVAFAGSIIPGVSAQASKWWDNLFKYSFFGPIMIFGVIIAVKLMNGIGASLKTAAGSAAPAGSVEANLIGNVAYMALPIVLLWIVMGVAQSMSIAGAGAVMGGAQKVMKGAGKKFSGYNAIKKNYDDYKKERDARKEEARFKIGKRFGEKVNDVQDTVAATVGPTKTIRDKAQKRMDKRRIDKNKKDIDEGAKDLVDQGETADSLASKVNTTFSTTPADKKGKVEQSKQAQAYLRQDHDERKMHIQNNLQTGGGSDLNDILNATVPTEYTPGSAQETAYITAQNAANLAAHNIRMATPGKANEKDLRMVAAFINRQMKHKVETGAKAK